MCKRVDAVPGERSGGVSIARNALCSPKNVNVILSCTYAFLVGVCRWCGESWRMRKRISLLSGLRMSPWIEIWFDIIDAKTIIYVGYMCRTPYGVRRLKLLTVGSVTLMVR